MNFDAINKHAPVSRETYIKLEKYVELLTKWNKSHNLIGRLTADDIWERHILDSLQLAQYVENSVDNTVDIGSGAGLPGLILAIARPELNVTLIESNRKKCQFLKFASQQCGAPVSVYEKRIEDCYGMKATLVTARALAPLIKLLEYAHGLLGERGKCLALKGQNYAVEIEEAHKIWCFDVKKSTSIIKKDGVILEIDNISKR